MKFRSYMFFLENIMQNCIYWKKNTIFLILTNPKYDLNYDKNLEENKLNTNS